MEEILVKVPKKKKSKKPLLKVAFVIDRSGSMHSCQLEAFNGINLQLDTIRENTKVPGILKYIQFDTVIETVFTKNIDELTHITNDQFEPRGGTALYDAIWTAINELEDEQDDDKVSYLVVVISDGDENSSHLVTHQKLQSEIAKREESGQWTFTYVMSNIDVAKFSHMVRSSANNVSSWNSAGGASSQTAFLSLANSTAHYLSEVTTAASVGRTYSTKTFNPNEFENYSKPNEK